ncbi:nudix hydrolase 10-like isoform X2 [Dioscorea cayenensis subsp. rotundata]|uniref:Nudix hydrolase 10-like isoform X2 n=1 Tax=Dioscorea cayennensis subsp. rotundata TaxID=55577 RepID=A0AB40BRH9_DIOCR|nr:nudix hydrolase 10-like isoform X2 [Dioscorea cayenensis subsp. rotundata]
MLRLRAPMLCFDVNSIWIPASGSLLSSFFGTHRIRAGSRSQSLRSPSRSPVSNGFRLRAAHHVNDRSSLYSVSPSSVVKASLKGQAETVELLSAEDDDHGGVIIEMKVPVDAGAFVSSLRASLENWRQQGKRGVWLKLPIEFANLVQPAVEEGFTYHHAEPNYLMLVYWIPATKNTLPVNATHRVGVGAFVMNDRREVLAVQEKSGKFRGSGVWKFPTGVVDQGEDLFVGAVREVKEETGIDTEFIEILAFRQSHKSFFEKSDLFFICLLRPLTFDIRKQESEIAAAKWVPIEEFAAQPFVHKHELLKYIIDVGLAKIDKDYAGFSPVQISSFFSDRKSYIYLNSKEMNQSSRPETWPECYGRLYLNKTGHVKACAHGILQLY